MWPHWVFQLFYDNSSVITLLLHIKILGEAQNSSSKLFKIKNYSKFKFIFDGQKLQSVYFKMRPCPYISSNISRHNNHFTLGMHFYRRFANYTGTVTG